MNYPELGITGLIFDDEYFEYHGMLRFNGTGIDLHFPLVEPATESDLIARHCEMLSLATSQASTLLQQAQSLAPAGGQLPPVRALIVYDDTFDLQFRSSNPEERQLWYEAMYNRDGTLYHFAEHVPPPERT